jgi:hypothetical protein
LTVLDLVTEIKQKVSSRRPRPKIGLQSHRGKKIKWKIVNIFYIMTSDLLQQTMALTKDRPILSSERAPHKGKTVKRVIHICS